MLSARFEVVAAHPADRIYAGGRSGLFHSADGGRSWSGTLPRWVVDLDPDPGDPRTVYATYLHGSFGVIDEATVRSTDGGETWSELPEARLGLEIAPGPPGEPSTLYWNGQQSRDGGESWEQVPLPDESAFLYAVVGTRPTTLYAARSDGFPLRRTLFRSHDGGETWTELSLPDQRNPEDAANGTAHPRAPDRLYASFDTGGLYAIQPLDAQPLELDDGRFEVRPPSATPAAGTARDDPWR